ncbi:hypothetical protein OS493_000706 [Desmophyllum pertusum]|uniref:Uncharacterized protein n=1 Tax=Desmophyllum pertusum TaxID=174260 RepID=A0A9X0DCS2_9CNID|nr:hypothetical protein OS493_000706 [Desmophyllum pertusum]
MAEQVPAPAEGDAVQRAVADVVQQGDLNPAPPAAQPADEEPNMEEITRRIEKLEKSQEANVEGILSKILQMANSKSVPFYRDQVFEQLLNLKIMFSLLDIRVDSTCNVSEITWNHLVSPKDKDGNGTTIQRGHDGVFGECQKMYFKGIPVAVKQLKQCIKALEDSSTSSVETFLPKVSLYGMCHNLDFDKYEAFRQAEQLAAIAQASNHEKASFYDLATSSMREQLLSTLGPPCWLTSPLPAKTAQHPGSTDHPHMQGLCLILVLLLAWFVTTVAPLVIVFCNVGGSTWTKKFYNKNLDAVTAEVEDYALTMKSLVEEFQATVVPMAQKCQASVVRMSNKDKEQCVEENEYEVVVLPDPSGRQEEND